jgi:hypothetical protein
VQAEIVFNRVVDLGKLPAYRALFFEYRVSSPSSSHQKAADNRRSGADDYDVVHREIAYQIPNFRFTINMLSI